MAVELILLRTAVCTTISPRYCCNPLTLSMPTTRVHCSAFLVFWGQWVTTVRAHKSLTKIVSPNWYSAECSSYTNFPTSDSKTRFRDKKNVWKHCDSINLKGKPTETGCVFLPPSVPTMFRGHETSSQRATGIIEILTSIMNLPPFTWSTSYPKCINSLLRLPLDVQ